jgi:CRP-like cAMP-binding protein
MESWWPVGRSGDLVGYFTDEEHARFREVLEPCSAEPGDLVFEKGNPSRTLLLVEEGSLEVFDESMGEVIVLARVGPGGVVGEVGFMDGQPRTHHVRARGACRLQRLSREALLGLVENDPGLFAKLAIALAQLLAFRFRSAVEELEPVRSFAAALREPLELSTDQPGFDEIDAPLIEDDPQLTPSPGNVIKIIRSVTRKGRKKGASTGV